MRWFHPSVAQPSVAAFTDSPASRRWFDRRPMQAFLLILALSFALDLFYIWLVPPAPHRGETGHTWPLVLNLAHGHGYSACFRKYFPFCGPGNDATAQREPLPVLIFAGVALLTNDSLVAASLVNIAVHLTILFVIFWLIQMLANARTALLGVTLWAIYLPAIKLITSISGDLMSALWVVLAVSLFVRARQFGQWYDWVAAGICIGFGVLTRSTVLVLVPVFVGGCLLWPRDHGNGARGALLRPLTYFALAVILVLSPWAVRNLKVFGRPIIGSTLIGYNLYRANYHLHSQHFLRYIDGPEAQRAVAHLLVGERTLHGTENEAEVDSVYLYAGLDVIKHNLARYLLLSAYRSLMLWFDIGVAPSDQIAVGMFGVLILIQQAVLLLMALVSVSKCWQQIWPLALGVAGVSVMYIAINSVQRYLLPVMPLTIVLSTIGVRLVWRMACRSPGAKRVFKDGN